MKWTSVKQRIQTTCKSYDQRQKGGGQTKSKGTCTDTLLRSPFFHLLKASSRRVLFTSSIKPNDDEISFLENFCSKRRCHILCIQQLLQCLRCGYARIVRKFMHSALHAKMCYLCVSCNLFAITMALTHSLTKFYVLLFNRSDTSCKRRKKLKYQLIPWGTVKHYC